MRHITNEEFNAACKDKINIRIVKAASKKYRRVLGEETIVCQLEGLWMALRSFDETRGTQFSTYLFEIVKRKCLTEVKRVQRKNKMEKNFPTYQLPEKSCHDSTLMNDIALSLSEKDAKLMSDRFLYNKTLVEIARENNVCFQAIDQRLDTLTKKIKLILTE